MMTYEECMTRADQSDRRAQEAEARGMTQAAQMARRLARRWRDTAAKAPRQRRR